VTPQNRRAAAQREGVAGTTVQERGHQREARAGREKKKRKTRVMLHCLKSNTQKKMQKAKTKLRDEATAVKVGFRARL
jgi:hypothetical protein